MNLLTGVYWRSLWATRRQLLLVVFSVCLLLAIADFMTRIWVARDGALRVFTSPRLPKATAAATVEQAQKQFAIWMPEPVPPPPPPPEWRLQGVLGSGSEIRAALVLVDPSGALIERFLLAKGESARDWIVQRIDRKGAQLKRGDETKDLILFPTKAE
jgi:hypothetical protein